MNMMSCIVQVSAVARRPLAILVHGNCPVAVKRPRYFLGYHLDSVKKYYSRSALISALDLDCSPNTIQIYTCDKIVRVCRICFREGVSVPYKLHCFISLTPSGMSGVHLQSFKKCLKLLATSLVVASPKERVDTADRIFNWLLINSE